MLTGLAAIALAVPLLGGCSSPPPPPPPPPPTIAEVTLSAAMDANPDAMGRASPVIVRVYELTAPHTVLQADFMQIYAKDAAVLGGDVRSRAEFSLAPGQLQKLRIEMKAESHGIAVVALFRDYLNANWRGYVDIPANKTTKVQAEIGARHVALTASAQ
jgi:type VI secretion system protein VasD